MSTKHKSESNKSNVSRNVVITLFSIALFIIIIFGSLNMMIFNKDLYYREYSKNGVYPALSENSNDKTTGVETAQNITENVMKYFRNTEELKYFSSTEKSHMADVKHLIRTMQFIYYGAAILSIGLFFYCYRRYKEDRYMFIKVLSKSLLYSSITAGIFLVMIFLMTVFSFEFLFTVFHLIFFPQGNWMFDSSSMLITMFPEQFFFDISLRIFVYAFFQALIFFGMGYWMRKQLKIYEMHHH
jgi:integral membrane protein (TIGR01906 family)